MIRCLEPLAVTTCVCLTVIVWICQSFVLINLQNALANAGKKSMMSLPATPICNWRITFNSATGPYRLIKGKSAATLPSNGKSILIFNCDKRSIGGA